MEISCEALDRFGTYATGRGATSPALLGADTAMGNDAYNKGGKQLGDVKRFTIDMASEKIANTVVSFGGLLGVGNKLFAVHWSGLVLNTFHMRFTLNVLRDALKDAPGFDKDHWPSTAAATRAGGVYRFYGTSFGRS
jgi:hypothetical protein